MTDRNETIISAYASGQTTRQVGAVFGLSHERIRQILVDSGVPRRGARKQVLDDALVALIEADGTRTVSDVATEFNISRDSLSQRVARSKFSQVDARQKHFTKVPHGSISRYTNDECRCDLCREANRRHTVHIPIGVAKAVDESGVTDLRAWAIRTLRIAADSMSVTA